MVEGNRPGSVFALQGELIGELGKIERFSAKNVLIQIAASATDLVVLDEIVRFINEYKKRKPTYIGTLQEASLSSYSDIMSDGASVCVVSYINGIAMGHTPRIDFSSTSHKRHLPLHARVAEIEEEFARIMKATKVKKIESLEMWPGSMHDADSTATLEHAVSELYPKAHATIHSPGTYAHWLMGSSHGSRMIVHDTIARVSYHNLEGAM